MIGQMFMVGLKATELSAEERLVFDELGIGGVLLLKHNLSDPEQIVALCCSLRDLKTDHPPFIAIDEEGGRVHRLPAPFTHFPPAAAIERKNDPDLAYRLGKATAKELRLVGINLNFAPVLDVNSNLQNPVIGDRSFAADPVKVIKFSEKWAQGLRDGGIIPCGKHFPGHGNTDKDSHLALPVVDRSLEELTAVELAPFAHACRNKMEALMTAHVLYPALDTKLAATLSHPIITGLLRQQWGYDGVVFSDDLEMNAISDNYGDEVAADFCARAGVDVLLYGHELAKMQNVFEFLASAAARDAVLRGQVENSYRRIANLKGRFLKTFTGVTHEPVRLRLIRFGHQRLIEAIYGNR
ncbi:MAG: beta-N-acetylhexosaminidase [Alphaproteobacteria bacterium]